MVLYISCTACAFKYKVLGQADGRLRSLLSCKIQRIYTFLRSRVKLLFPLDLYLAGEGGG